MKKHLMKLVALFSVTVLFAACSSGGGGGTSTPTVSGNGIVSVTPSSAFSVVSNGVSVSVPAGAYDASVTKPTITVAKSVTGLPSGATLPAGGQLGDVYTITKDYANNFLAPVDVTLPYDPAVTALPMVYYWDAANGKYVAAAIQKIDPVAKTVTFSTSHFSTYVVLGNSNFNNATTTVPTISTGFNPSTDGFFHPSFGTFTTPAGTAYGMCDFSAWYFYAKKASDTNKLYSNAKGLYNKYREGDAMLYQDDTTARQLIGQAQNAASNTWANVWTTPKYTLDGKTTGLLLMAAMQNSGLPQMLIMKSVDSSLKNVAAQPVVVYGFTPNSAGTAGVFNVYDPKFPGEPVTLAWSLANGFGVYGKAGAFNYTFNSFAFDGLPTVAESAQFNTLFTAAEATNLGGVTVTAPVLAGSDAVITISGSAIPDQTVSGTITVPSGMAFPTYLKYTVNSGTETILQLTGSTFSFTLKGTGLNTTANTITLTATSSLANPYDIKAFKQFTISFVGTSVASFINAGFENYSSIGSKGFTWKVETHMWQDVTARDTTGSPFPLISSTPDPAVKNGASRSDANGKYYSPTGTVNPNFNAKWGFVTAYTADTWKDSAGKGKSAVVSQGSDPIFKAFTDYLGQYTPVLVNDSGLSSLAMVWNGLKALRVNNEDDSYHASTASQTAVIKDPALKLAWAAVLEDPAHDFPNQPFVEITVRDETLGTDLYHKHYFSGDPSYNGWVVLSTGWKVIPWQVLNLDVSGAIGHSVSIKVYASDCGFGGHGGYAYLDDAQ